MVGSSTGRGGIGGEPDGGILDALDSGGTMAGIRKRSSSDWPVDTYRFRVTLLRR